MLRQWWDNGNLPEHMQWIGLHDGKKVNSIQATKKMIEQFKSY